jgi:hypothetical protein
MDLYQFSESDGLPQIEKVWELDVNELVIEPKPFARGAFSQVYKVSKPTRMQITGVLMSFNVGRILWDKNLCEDVEER